MSTDSDDWDRFSAAWGIGRVFGYYADGMLSTENIDKIKRRGERFDLAVLPYWFAEDRGLHMLRQFIQTIEPKRIALIHLPATRLEKMRGDIKRLKYKDLIVPEPGEKIGL